MHRIDTRHSVIYHDKNIVMFKAPPTVNTLRIEEHKPFFIKYNTKFGGTVCHASSTNYPRYE